MSVFEVTGVHDRKEWEGKFGSMVSYVLDLHDVQNDTDKMDVELNRKPESREPQIGEQFVGDLTPGPYGEKLKIDFEATKELGKGGSREASTGTSGGSQNVSKGQGGGEVDWDRRNAEIRRQHSQEMALRMLDVGAKPETFGISDADLDNFVKRLADWFDQDAIDAGQRASQGAAPILPGGSPRSGAAPGSPPAEQPVDFTGARKEEHTVPISDLDDYRMLLSSAGLEPAAARDKVAEYMGLVLPADRLKKATVGLQELERQGDVLEQLKMETERWIKGALPQGDALDADESIPF
jgi:hypothetical protein